MKIRRTSLRCVLICLVVLGAGPAVARDRAHMRPRFSRHPVPQGQRDAGTAAVPTDRQKPLGGNDELYRTKGYGQGGLPFVLGGQGGLDLLGACAYLANRQAPCESPGPTGFGPYNNGIGYGFGLP